jgi:hypothetical protein
MVVAPSSAVVVVASSWDLTAVVVATAALLPAVVDPAVAAAD